MGVLKNDVGRPSNKTIKIRFILKAVLLIIVAGGLFLGGYLLNNVSNDKKVDNKNTQEEQKNKVDIKAAEEILVSVFGDTLGFDVNLAANLDVINSQEYKTLLALSKTKAKQGKYSCEELYGNFNVTKFDNYSSDIWSVSSADGMLCQDYDEYYEYEDVNEKYKYLFGNEGHAKQNDIHIGLVIHYGYSNSKNVYSALSCQCGDGGYGFINSVSSVKQEADKLYIDYIYGYYDGFSYELILNDGTYIKMSEEELNKKEIFEKYKDRLFELQFIFFEEDGVYKFEKVIKK